MIELLPNLAALKHLRKAFQRHNRDIRVVGGCVRDVLLGKTPADIDLCTDATPDEQRKIYESEGIRHVGTGLHHGTWTVVLYHDNEQVVLEVTSLRIDTNQDGRHATVVYTRDWELDLSRRDLTINAMALTLDDVLVDPFGGAEDLRNGRVIFVGNAEERIREDYLRILRWIRFSARYSKHGLEHGGGLYLLDAATRHLVSYTEIAKGLLKISRERVWAEMAKIVSGPSGELMLFNILHMGIYKYIDLPLGNSANVAIAAQYTNNPVTLMAAFCVNCDDSMIGTLAEKWKWSAEERHMGKFICQNLRRNSWCEVKRG